MIAADKENQIQGVCQTLYPTTPDWVTFYREILGPDGIIRQMFPSAAERAKFKETPAYAEILRMVTELRRKGPLKRNHEELTDTITVRVPRCVYDSLAAEAKELHTTLNQMCISKLIQPIDRSLVREVGYYDKITRRKRRQANR